ncbi:MAG: hypothetical protein Q7S66_02220 [bacterium]|nr:hypothetical protein [bacterium]
MGKFNKGLFLGGLLGAGLIWLNATPKGKEMKAKIAEYLEPLYAELKISMTQLEGPTKEMYEALVDRAVEEFAARKDMAMDMKAVLIRKLKQKWADLEKEMKK